MDDARWKAQVVDYKKVGVVMPTCSVEGYDKIKELYSSVFSLYRQSLQPAEFVIVDDMSDEKYIGSIKEICKGFGCIYVRFEREHKDYSFCRAINLGCSILTTPVVLITCDDYVYMDDALAKMSYLHETYGNLLIQPHPYYYKDKDWKANGFEPSQVGQKDYWRDNSIDILEGNQSNSIMFDIRPSRFNLGVLSVRAEHFLAWDNRFIGWGNDDMDIVQVAKCFSLYPAIFDDIPAYHLPHERAYNITGQQLQASIALYKYKWQISDFPNVGLEKA